MVARRAPRKSFRRRRAVPRKKAVRRTRRANVAVSSSSPIPDRFITKMRYSSLHALVTGGAGPVTHQFRINSIYDPDLTGGGHQPLGHDQFQTLYLRYVVRGMSYVVTFTNQSTTDYADIAIVFHPNTSMASAMSTALESTYCRRGVVGPETGSRNVLIMKGYMSVAKIRGISRTKVNNENDYNALFGANPIITPCMTLYAENQNVAAAIQVNARVDLVYYVSLYDRIALSQS